MANNTGYRWGVTPVGAYQKIVLPWHRPNDQNQEEENIRVIERVDWGQGQGTRWRTIVIAASNSTALSKQTADFVCAGAADQVLINQIISLQEGRLSTTQLGRIVLLEGTYRITAPINITTLTSRSLAIEGMAGDAQSDLSVTGTHIIQSSTSGAVFSCQGVGGDPSGTVTIENLSMVSASSTSCIASRDMTMQVRMCRIVNTGSGGGINQTNSTGGSSNSIVDGCYVSSAGGATAILLVDGPTRSTASFVRNCVVFATGSGAVGISTGNDASSTPGYHVNDNAVYMTGSTSGIGINIRGTSTQYNMVANNTIVGSVVTGISIAGFGSTVTGNFIANCTNGIIDGAFECDFTNITGNNITACTGIGIRIGNTTSIRSVIMGNTITNAALTGPTTGVQIGSSATDCAVLGNDIYAAGTAISDSGVRTRTDTSLLPPGSLLPVGGTANQVLKKNSSTNYDVSWAVDPAIALAAAKGDLLVGLASQVMTNLSAGRDGTILISDSTSTTGVRWGSKLTINKVAPSSPQPGDIWMDTT